ncbi:hypothetical protein [Rhizobium hidalgonense]|uniref:hypothetical protein n=1 Tax=Rhizobium hidalgonense TaxID=1538159 RepID=UPI002871CC7C|nr:hypothetical protein [Rhizobium hidalgonense]MDR9805534.1 hypothetical protein [Rhizobium hidalgonense]
MISPEVGFIIFFTSNLTAPLLAFFAGRIWPGRRMALHILAVIWIVLSVYLCERLTFTPDTSTVDDSYEPDEMLQFEVVVMILLQQLVILAAYAAFAYGPMTG